LEFEFLSLERVDISNIVSEKCFLLQDELDTGAHNIVTKLAEENICEYSNSIFLLSSFDHLGLPLCIITLIFGCQFNHEVLENNEACYQLRATCLHPLRHGCIEEMVVDGVFEETQTNDRNQDSAKIDGGSQVWNSLQLEMNRKTPHYPLDNIMSFQDGEKTPLISKEVDKVSDDDLIYVFSFHI
jgi:hypothetical protein